MSRQGRFEIYLAWSERVLTVEPGQSALQAMIEAGIPSEPGCGTGTCGTCVTEYVDGDLIHKDSCLTPEDRQHNFCPCVSVARTRIVLPL